MSWTRYEIDHPSGKRIYVAVSEDGTRLKLKAHGAALRITDFSNRRGKNGKTGAVDLEWSQDFPWGS